MKTPKVSEPFPGESYVLVIEKEGKQTIKGSTSDYNKAHAWLRFHKKNGSILHFYGTKRSGKTYLG
jgi:hypothetical protein